MKEMSSSPQKPEIQIIGEKYKLVFDNCTDAMIVFDAAGKVIDANQGTVKLFKYTVSELLRVNAADIFPPKIWQDLANGGDRTHEEFECQIIDKNGKVIPVVVLIRSLEHEGEKTFYAFFRDLQQQKRLLNELNERSNELACLYSISKAKEERGTLEEIFTDVAHHIIVGLHAPEEASAIISYRKKTYQSRKFKVTLNSISEKIIIKDQEKGEIRLYYPEDRIFCLNEKNLLTAVTQSIHRIIERKEVENRLLQDRKNLVNIIREIGIGISLIDRDFNIVWVNELLEQLFGDISSVKGSHCYKIFHGKNTVCKQCPLQRTFQKGTVEMETRCVSTSSKKHYYQFTTAPIFDENNQVVQGLTLSQNISDTREMEAKLKEYSENLETMVTQRTEMLMESEEKYRTFMENSSDLMGILNTEGVFVYVNESFTWNLGYKKNELLKINIRDVIQPDDSFSFNREMGDLKIYGKITQVRIKLGSRDGRTIVGELNATAIADSDNRYKGARVIIRDITGRIKAEEEIKKLIITDNLTGLYNQRHFYDQLAKEVERGKRTGRPLSLLLFDIDNFKDYNDSFGHLEGDKVLTKMGSVLTRHIRNIDLGFRYGGEEFTIILPDSDINHAVRVAKRLREAFSNCLFIPEGKSEDVVLVYKTISIGIAQYRLGENFKSLVKNADDAMYIAKRAGGDRIHIFHAYHS